MMAAIEDGSINVTNGAQRMEVDWLRPKTINTKEWMAGVIMIKNPMP